jgi:hypothetical protein
LFLISTGTNITFCDTKNIVYWIYLQGIYVCNSKKCLNITIYMTLDSRLDGVPPVVV